MDKIYISFYNSPIGYLKIFANDNGIFEIDYVSEINEDSTNCTYIEQCIFELDKYFNGKLKQFSIKLDIRGTNFQQKVWNSLLKIPYGQTMTYKQIAFDIGNEKASRAVGNANNKNKIPIIIPCHRVIGSNNAMVGYAGDVWRKEWLLNHEKKFILKV